MNFMKLFHLNLSLEISPKNIRQLAVAARPKFNRKKDATVEPLDDFKKRKMVVISCKDQKLNHYLGQNYPKFTSIPLASNNWQSKKSKGDYFCINAYSENPALSQFPEKDGSYLSFTDIGLPEDIVKLLEEQGIMQPTNIQKDSIPTVLRGKNTLIAAQTGCGKTLAYLLPMLKQVIAWKEHCKDLRLNSPLGLIICPNRGLAAQVFDVLNDFLKHLKVRGRLVVGGRTKKSMYNPEFSEIDIVVATLGGLSKLTTNGIFKMNYVRHLVLDEADTLLDDSFNEKLCHFLKHIPLRSTGQGELHCFPEGCQLTLASATMPLSVSSILQDVVDTDTLVKVTHQLHQVLPHVPQKFIRLGKSQKSEELLRIAKGDHNAKRPLIIFSNKASTCDWISLFLNEHGVRCVNLNGKMAFVIRKGKFDQFQSGMVNVLSCTDIGSRGLNTIRAKHIVNYDFPLYVADYIHRCGRTGRVGSPEECRITNFVSGPLEVELVQKIEMSVRKMDTLPNVNNNIPRIIAFKEEKKEINSLMQMNS